MQYAIADFMAECPEHARELPRFYQRKRDLFRDLMAPSRFRFTPSQGSYFQLADYSAISDLPDREFANWLTREIGVAAIPLSPFYRKPSGARATSDSVFARKTLPLNARRKSSAAYSGKTKPRFCFAIMKNSMEGIVQ